jgi:hypothetical protein
MVPSFLAGVLIFAGFGLSKIDFSELLAEKPYNNVATAQVKDPEVVALEQSIVRANELDRQDKSLADIIKEQVDNYPSDQKWSVYVNQLGGGSSASVNADQLYDAGSLHKLFLLAPLESKIPVDQWQYYWTGGYNVGSCVSLFLSASDDSCSDNLGGYVNWDYIEEYNQGIGFINTTLDEGRQPQTNAREVGQLLSQLKTSKLLTDLGRRHVFDTLYHQDYIHGLPATCEDCVVANKSSNQDNFIHDAGVITRGQKDYVVVIMSQGGTTKQIAQLARAIDKQLSL